MALPDGIIDGEIVALDANGTPDFAALQVALSEGRTEDLIFFAFDLLFDGTGDLRKLPLSERKTRLQEFLSNGGDNALIRFVQHFEKSGEAVLRSVCRLSIEGIVSKKLDAPLSIGTHSHLDESQVPGGARGRHRRVDYNEWHVQVLAHWRQPR